jgi:LPS export ABC transporter protein LptC
MTKLLFHKTFFIAAALTGCFFLFGCENSDESVKAWTGNKAMVEEARKVESYLSQDGKMKAKLTAPIMLRAVDSQYVEFPQTLHCDFFNDSTRVETWLDCKYGKYFESLNKVYLRDSVVVINIKGDTLKAPDLWWDQALKIFYTEKFATYHGINKNIYGGKGLTATQDLGSIIFNEPTGTIKGSENGFTQ